MYKSILQRLSRVTKSTTLIPEVDGLRFLAIAPVVFMHLCTNFLRVNNADFSEEQLAGTNFLYDFLNKGAIGVHLFFVISGFVLALPFVRHYFKNAPNIELKQYYLRRLTRLEPPFIISMLLFFVAWVIVGKYALSELLNSLWASLLYVHFFVFGKWSIINPISWSLETEIQFYVLAPMIFMVFLIKNSKIRWCALFLSMIACTLVVMYSKQTIDEYHLGKSLLIYFPFFITGMGLADIYVNHTSFFWGKSLWWDCLGVTGLFLLYYFPWHQFLLQNAAIAVLFIAAFKGKWLNFFFAKKEIVVIGGMCYSIYLIHYGLLYLLMFVTKGVYVNGGFEINYVIQTLIIIPIVLVVSALFFLLFEKPFMYSKWYVDFPKSYFNNLSKIN